MRNYRLSTATTLRVEYGVELVAGLSLFPETTPLAAPFEKINDGLDAASAARKATRKPLVKARVELRLAGYLADQAIRSASRGAEIADGGRRGPIFAAIFPGGLDAVVRPSGAQQLAPTKALVDRLTKSRVDGVDAYRTEWLPRLSGPLDRLVQASAALDAVRVTHEDAFDTEIALRDQHRVEVDRIMGQVRAAFPGDRKKQDVIFPEVQETPAEPPAKSAPVHEAPAIKPPVSEAPAIKPPAT